MHIIHIMCEKKAIGLLDHNKIDRFDTVFISINGLIYLLEKLRREPTMTVIKMC